MSAIILRILGKSGSGKTTFITNVVEGCPEFKISVIKHTRHHLQPPNPLKDTGRHFVAGATMVAGLSDQSGELFFQEPCMIDFADIVTLFSVNSDVVIVEGARDQDLPTILIGDVPDNAQANNIIFKLPICPDFDAELLTKIKKILKK